ncbi:MAG: cation transporter [Proteobacteria bacterium]|nr:cation transporter [Pseudomonadota bacterium]
MHKKEVKKTLLIAFFLNIAVAIAKLTYGILTGTLTMISDGVHSVMDGFGSLMGLVTVEFASRPSDHDHHYGHRKYEMIGALGIATLVALAGWEILQKAFERWMHPSESIFHVSGVWIALITICINYLLSRYEFKKGQQLQSHILKADSVHTGSDVWVSVSVLVSLFAIKFQIQWVDTVISVLIAIYFWFAAYKLIRENFMVLTDAAFLDVQMLKDLALKENGVISCHRVRTRGTPNAAYVDLHIQVAPETTTLASHRMAHNIENRIQKEFPGIIEVLVHTEPYPDPDDED